MLGKAGTIMRISKGWFIGLTIFFVLMILVGLIPMDGSTNITLSLVFLLAQIGITVWYLVGRTRPAPYRPSPLWKCPRCQAILIKGSPELASLLGPEKIVGTATCTSCGATFPQSMVYSGIYDVPTDQALLAETTRTASDSDIRRRAVEKLTDQTLLAEIAKTGQDKYICARAVEKLTD